MNSLVSYSESSSEDEERMKEDNKRIINKRRLDINETMSAKEIRCSDDKKSKIILPLPGAISCMFDDARSRVQDDPTKYNGRIRSFPHVEGNWASYVYIPVNPDERLKTFVNHLLLCLQPVNFQSVEDFHISLSRTVCIRHHWIQPLMESLKEQVHKLQRCTCEFQSLKLYTNDEKTRTFISLEVSSIGPQLRNYTAAVDQCFREFKLPSYYSNPSFHISLVWCVGDVVAQIAESTKVKMQRLTQELICNNPDLSIMLVTELCLKTGNKTFSFYLSESNL